MREAVPRFADKVAMPVRAELRALRNARLWLVLGATVLVMGGCMGTFSYISPLLTERAGVSLALVPLVFVCFGIGSMVGTNVVGRFADRRPVATFIACAVGTALVLAMLIPLSGRPVTAVIVITLRGVVTMAIPPVATGLSVRLADSAPTLAAAVTVSAFNGGIAFGSAIGGHPRTPPPGEPGPAAVGIVTALLSLIPLIAIAMNSAGRTNTSSNHQVLPSGVAQGAHV